MAEFKNESGLEFTDISSEAERRYIYESGAEFVVKAPLFLNVSASGGHRLFDDSGRSYYVRPGWVAITWTVHDGAPNFVK